MNTYKTYVQIDASGRLVLEGLPFSAGSLLEKLVVDQTHQPEERVESWRTLMCHVQGLPQSQVITDEEIVAEIEAQRSGAVDESSDRHQYFGVSRDSRPLAGTGAALVF